MMEINCLCPNRTTEPREAVKESLVRGRLSEIQNTQTGGWRANRYETETV